MKKIMNMAILIVSLTIFQCCSADDPLTDESSWQGWDNTAAGSGSSTTASGELLTFDVTIDADSAEPESTADAYYPDSEDMLANNSFPTEVNITYSGTSVVVDAADGVSVSTDGAHVVADHGSTKGVCYVVSGTSDAGSLTIVGDKKYEVKLSGVTLTNPDSTALNLLSKKRAFVVVSGSNTLTDGTASKADDQKAAFYCKGKLLVSGSGALSVYGNYKNAIHTADYLVLSQGTRLYAKSTAGNGIKANDGVFINGGVLNVEVSAAAAKGINCESNIIVSGGRTTVITTGTGAYEDGEAKGAAAVKCDSTFTMNGGEVYLKSTGAGGKGLKADYEAYLNGGTLRVVTTGASYTFGRDSASPKGVKIGTKNVHGLLNISGGDIMVRTTGYAGEGIESKGTITISDNATVQVSAYDDAINSSGDMYIMGGSVTAVGTSNDGLDSNGNMYISGGTIVAFGAGGAETGIDTGEQYKLYITGGNIFGIGGRIDTTIGSTTQGIVSTTASVTANTAVTVADGTTTLATFTMPPYNYSSGTVMLSVPGMSSGSSYTVNWGSSTSSLTATSSVSSSMGGNMGGGGGMPGGRR